MVGTNASRGAPGFHAPGASKLVAGAAGWPRSARRLPAVLALIAALLLAAGCGSKPQRVSVLGVAYVGPYKLDLIAELSPEAPVVATLKHGERVEILQRHRRFVRLRTASGITGWADGRLLLDISQMARLRRLSMRAARLPSQGKATVYDALNVHTAPNRQAPSFYRLEEGMLVQVVGRRPCPRGPDHSASPEAALVPLNSYAPPGRGCPGRCDEWSLVRLSDGRAGWVLARQLVMAIPDEVAQYAAGRRITSYFSLGQVVDHGEIKHDWLWTTVSRNRVPYQFDSFRVFVWSRRRHRYETAHIERHLVGYYPTVVEQPAGKGKEPAPVRFALIVRNKRGVLERRWYRFQGNRVRRGETAPWQAPVVKGESWSPAPAQREAAREKSLFGRFKQALARLIRR